MQKNCSKFLELLHNDAYYEAHEVLEEIWFPRRKSKEPEVLSLKAFINASVAFELHKRGKKEHALKVWQTYLKYKPKIAQADKDIFLKMEKIVDEYGSKLLS